MPATLDAGVEQLLPISITKQRFPMWVSAVLKLVSPQLYLVEIWILDDPK